MNEKALKLQSILQSILSFQIVFLMLIACFVDANAHIAHAHIVQRIALQSASEVAQIAQSAVAKIRQILKPFSALINIRD